MCNHTNIYYFPEEDYHICLECFEPLEVKVMVDDDVYVASEDETREWEDEMGHDYMNYLETHPDEPREEDTGKFDHHELPHEDETGGWVHNLVYALGNHVHHPECQCNLCVYGTAAIPASEY